MNQSILDQIEDWKSKIIVAREIGVKILPCPRTHSFDRDYCFRCENTGYVNDVKPKSLTPKQVKQIKPIVKLLTALSCGFEDQKDLSITDIAKFLASRNVQIGETK